MMAAVLGDINSDSIVDLSDYDLSVEEVRNGCIFRSVKTAVGGNGIFFAEAAKESAFERVFLLGCVGSEGGDGSRPDPEGAAAIRWLERMGIDTRGVVVSSGSTGKVLILYQCDDRRLLVADRGANECSCSELLDATRSLPRGIDLLYVSGYWLVDDSQLDRVVEVVDLLKERGAFIMVDVVPHNVYNRFSYDTFLERIAWADGIAVEASTLGGFVGASEEKIEEEATREVLQVLKERYELCIVRLNSRSDFLLTDRHGHERIYLPYREHLSSLRFTDRVAAAVLRRHLDHDQCLWPSSEWVESLRRRVSSRTPEVRTIE